MSRFNRRSLLGYSMFGAGAALFGGQASAAGIAAKAGGGDPYANDGAEQWVIDETSAVAETESGKVIGYIRNGVRIFQDIPYAQIPAGEGRWQRGVKMKPWAGKRSARAPGTTCPPPTSGGNTMGNAFALHMLDYQAPRPGEDCLRINICTPGLDNKKRQVLFWCHGGGYSSGNALMATRFEGHNLAKYGDVVVVSMNHRLNAFGFLNLTAFGSRYSDSANIGMLDVVDALKWVKANIANFGGDPDKVMIFGHSGGGAKVLTLLGMPEAKGLFNAAVSQSPGPLELVLTQEQSEGVTASFLKLADVSPSNIEAIHKLSTAKIADVAAKLLSAFNVTRLHAKLAGTAQCCAPTIDGRTLLYHPAQPNVASDVPLMVGTALHENFVALDHPEYDTMPESQGREILRDYFGASGDDIYDVYKKAFPKVIPFEITAMARAMGHFRAPAVKAAQARAAMNSAPSYNYQIQWRAKIFEGRAMTHHEIEIPLVFMNSDAIPNVTGGTAEARKLSVQMADTWLAFARTGDPNTKALPKWNPVKPGEMNTMIFDTQSRIDHGFDLAAIEMSWKALHTLA